MTYLLRLVACLSLCVSLNTFGALSIRDLDGDLTNGHEGVYDDVLDITWLADANLSENLPLGTEGYHKGQNYADTWINNFSSYNGTGFFGYDGWRLPKYSNAEFGGTAGPPHNTTFNGSRSQGFNYYNTDSELGYMFYVNLGNISAFDFNGNSQGSTPHENIYDNAEGLFNPYSGAAQYWSGTDICTGCRRLAFYFNGGYQDTIAPTSNPAGIWPVHDGDIGASPVPLPAGIYLFLSGLVGLSLMRNKRSK